jgi:hypothetical protein
MKDYAKYGLYAIGAILTIGVLYFIYTTFIRAKAGAANVADSIANVAEDGALAKQNGVNEYEVNEARTLAKKLAYELETDKDMSLYDKILHLTLNNTVIDLCKQAKTGKEFRLMSYFYKNNFTTGRSMHDDLKDALMSREFNALPFVSFLK